MSASLWSILISGGMLGWALIARRLLVNPRGDVETGIFWHLCRWYARLWHGLRVEGLENLPTELHPGPLVVVCNHTAGVDPLLVQSVALFEIRWMMGKDMMAPALAGFWRWSGVIEVDRLGTDRRSARDALAHLKSGGVLGVFPEGRLERPPRHVLPFLPGVGLIVARSGARVLPFVVDGTPDVGPAWASLIKRSRSRVRVMPAIDYAGVDAGAIVEDLRRRYVHWTGWPREDHPQALRPRISAQTPA